jgi:AraC-like DNA-binding protein
VRVQADAVDAASVRRAVGAVAAGGAVGAETAGPPGDAGALSAASAAGTLWLSDGGALRCRTARRLRVLPSTLALWLPADVPARVQGIGGARLQRVELVLDGGLPPQPGCDDGRVVLAGPLLTALAATLAATPDGGDPDGPRRRLAAALVREELLQARPLPLGITLPREAALRAVCEAVMHDGGRECELEALAVALDMSTRGLARHFRRELQTTFGQWRLQVRLARAVELWAEGRTLSASAAAVGYASPSAFSFMVRRVVGMTPRRFLASRSGRSGFTQEPAPSETGTPAQ